MLGAGAPAVLAGAAQHSLLPDPNLVSSSNWWLSHPIKLLLSCFNWRLCHSVAPLRLHQCRHPYSGWNVGLCNNCAKWKTRCVFPASRPSVPETIFLLQQQGERGIPGRKGAKGQKGEPGPPGLDQPCPVVRLLLCSSEVCVTGTERECSFAAREREGGFGRSLVCSKSEQMVIVFSLFLMVCFICTAGSSVLALRAPHWPDGNKPQQ